MMLMFGPLAMPHNLPDRTPTDTVSPLTVSGQKKDTPADAKINMAGSDADAQLVGIWPGTAYHNGVSGKVRLKCWIDVHGLAERCEVAQENPRNMGFGKAALEMRAVIKLAPPRGPTGPVSGFKTIDIGFQAPDMHVDQAGLAHWQHDVAKGPLAGTDVSDFLEGSRNGLSMRKVTMLDNPVWVAAAGFDDLVAAYPGKSGGGEGYAVDHCRVQRDGTLGGCQTIMEEPTSQGFGKSALSLAAKFRVSAQVAQTPHNDELWVDIPVRFPTAKELAERTVMAPSWVQVFDGRSTPKLFPPEAAASGLTSGRGVARCTVGPDGAMTDCRAEPGDPDGLGFSEAAVKLAGTMRMNLWAADGVPVTGAVVRIPIRLNLKGAGSLNPTQ
jgi:TonB family protein